jgi:TonB family protein
VRFSVDRSGRVLEFSLMRGTGSASLDAAIGRMLSGAQLPGFPPAMTQDRTTLTVQIRYALE